MNLRLDVCLAKWTTYNEEKLHTLDRGDDCLAHCACHSSRQEAFRVSPSILRLLSLTMHELDLWININYN